MTHQLILVEDDPEIAELLIEYLSANQYELNHYNTAQSGTAAILANPNIDAVILDVMLPDGDGFEICKTIRQHQQTPIIMLTARGDTMDKILGLELGADDYLAKPFEPRELLARLKAVIRRQQATHATPDSNLQFGELLINKAKREATIKGVSCDITNHQFELLLYLAEHAGQVLSRDQLMNALKQQSLEAFDRSIDVHISRIRAAIETNPKKPERIKTVRGAGYLFTL